MIRVGVVPGYGAVMIVGNKPPGNTRPADGLRTMLIGELDGPNGKIAVEGAVPVRNGQVWRPPGGPAVPGPLCPADAERIGPVGEELIGSNTTAVPKVSVPVGSIVAVTLVGPSNGTVKVTVPTGPVYVVAEAGTRPTVCSCVPTVATSVTGPGRPTTGRSVMPPGFKLLRGGGRAVLGTSMMTVPTPLVGTTVNVVAAVPVATA